MASEEHQSLANYLKEVHLSLRKASNKLGAEQAWREHCENKEILKSYSKCMEKLATSHWSDERNETSEAVSRIKWNADFCFDYFLNKLYLKYRDKEAEVASRIYVDLITKESFSYPIKLCDVGSCYNPFSMYDFLDVLPIDLCPANETVYECDFLQIPIGQKLEIVNSKIEQLCASYFDVVTFCFLLEYLPTSDLRILACEKAYKLLKPGGLLLINTPDSKHVGANSKIMKCWQYALATMGFSRIKYVKLKHMHCVAFRKAICKATAVRWAELHKEPYMEYAIHIPQDFNVDDDNDEKEDSVLKTDVLVDDFLELPFCDSE